MRTNIFIISAVVLSGVAGLISTIRAEDKPGYTDTPMLPSGKWHVHDPNRPVPPVVTPGGTFSDLAPAPSDAVVLFDGTDFSHWEGAKGDVQWTIHGNYMECKPDSGSIHTKDKFGDFQLHVEWAEPPPVGNSQERGNSGVFLQGVYEIQVLDSYDNPTYPDGQCGAVYGQSPPLANVCRPPGQWQTYDIIFQAARWDEDHKLTRPASVTIFQNGVLIQNHQAILGPSGHRTLANYKKELPATGPIELQDHHNTVRYRNIWIRNITDEEKP
jgi:hypothetical protein